MKLWLCGAVTTDSDCPELIVAETEKQAKEKYEKCLDDVGIWYASIYVDEVKEIDGYEIVVREKRHYAKGSNYFN